MSVQVAAFVHLLSNSEHLSSTNSLAKFAQPFKNEQRRRREQQGVQLSDTMSLKKKKRIGKVIYIRKIMT